MTQFAPEIYDILKNLLRPDAGFAVGNEPSSWTNGLRFTVYDVRSQTSMMEGNPFDELIWKIEDELKAAEFPVAAVLKGKRLCMIDIDCRIKLQQPAGELLVD